MTATQKALFMLTANNRNLVENISESIRDNDSVRAFAIFDDWAFFNPELASITDCTEIIALARSAKEPAQ